MLHARTLPRCILVTGLAAASSGMWFCGISHASARNCAIARAAARVFVLGCEVAKCVGTQRRIDRPSGRRESVRPCSPAETPVERLVTDVGTFNEAEHLLAHVRRVIGDALQ